MPLRRLGHRYRTLITTFYAYHGVELVQRFVLPVSGDRTSRIVTFTALPDSGGDKLISKTHLHSSTLLCCGGNLLVAGVPLIPQL